MSARSSASTLGEDTNNKRKRVENNTLISVLPSTADYFA